jgi:hypothetical protein
MKKFLLSLGLVLLRFVGMGQVVTYNFASLTGITTSVAPTTTITGATATNLVRGSGLTASSASAGFNSTAWTTAASKDANDYLEFTITSDATHVFNISGITTDFLKSNATGSPQTVEITTRVGAGAEVTQGTQSIAAGTTGTVNIPFVLNTVNNNETTVIRIYAFGGTNGSATFRLTGTLTFNGSAPLPITLISFKANITENQQTVLKWATASEKDNDYFEIERSKNALDFESVGKIKGKGTIDLRNDYTFTDESPLKGINYYRLKQVDFDGQFSYTRAESVIRDGDGSISLYPNPTANILKINFEDTEQIENTTIYNMMGRVVKTISGNQGKYEISELPQGKYILQIGLSDGRIIRNSFIKN